MYKQACRAYPQLIRSWEDAGQPKIALKIESEEEMLRLVKEAKKVGLPAASIRDAGRTQVASGTRTVAAIGPGKSEGGLGGVRCLVRHQLVGGGTRWAHALPAHLHSSVGD